MSAPALDVVRMPAAESGITGLSELSGVTTHRGPKRPMSDAYVGFYWTLPVFWSGFRSLPTDVEAASAKSRTIRYQRERVRRHVADQAGRLTDEMVFIDVRTDRGTPVVLETLERARTLCTTRGASLLYVEFAQAHHWRRHPALQNFLHEHAFAVGLSPDPIGIDGRLFDPIQHFQNWRRRDTSETAKRRRNAMRALVALADQVPVGPGRYALIASTLNERQIPTKTGLPWSSENVRVALRRQSSLEAEGQTADETPAVSP